MAYIDKIYGNIQQWFELWRYLEEKCPEGLKHMYECPDSSDGNEWPLSNFPREIDVFLMENCDIDFVVDRLKEQYREFRK